MCVNEAERRQLLALQAFYLETKRAMEELEKKLKAKKSKENEAEAPLQKELRG